MLCLEQGNPQEETLFGKPTPNLDDASSSSDPTTSNTSVSELQHLGPYDVVCGRHKAAFNNIGNRRFRVTVSLQLARYMAAPTRKDKSILIKSAAALVRSNGGRFLQRKNNAWVELDEKAAHDKVGHALRDMATAASAKGASTSNNGGGSTNGSSTTMRTGLSPKAASAAFKASQRKIPKNIEVVAVTNSHIDVLPNWNDPMEDCVSTSGFEEETQEDQPEYECGDFSVHEDELFPVDYSNLFSTSSEYPQVQLQREDLAEEQASGVAVPQREQQEQEQHQSQTDERLHPLDFLDVEPLPWRAQTGGQRPSVDDQMLSWLVSESDTLLLGTSSEC